MKKEFQGLKVEKVYYGNTEILTGSTCKLVVVYDDDDRDGLCDQAQYPDHPQYGSYAEWYDGPSASNN